MTNSTARRTAAHTALRFATAHAANVGAWLPTCNCPTYVANVGNRAVVKLDHTANCPVGAR